MHPEGTNDGAKHVEAASRGGKSAARIAPVIVEIPAASRKISVAGGRVAFEDAPGWAIVRPSKSGKTALVIEEFNDRASAEARLSQMLG